MTILLVINAIIFYYYAKNRSKEKGIDVLTIKKMENDEFEKFCIKNYTCYYFHDKTKFEDSDIDNISTVKKSYENILIYKISYNTLIGLNHLRIRFNNMEGFIRVYEGTRYLVIFGSEYYDASFNMIRY